MFKNKPKFLSSDLYYVDENEHRIVDESRISKWCKSDSLENSVVTITEQWCCRLNFIETNNSYTSYILELIWMFTASPSKIHDI